MNRDTELEHAIVLGLTGLLALCFGVLAATAGHWLLALLLFGWQTFSAARLWQIVLRGK